MKCCCITRHRTEPYMTNRYSGSIGEGNSGEGSAAGVQAKTTRRTS